MLAFGGDRAGAKRKERGVEELYIATDTVDEVEITSVLSGSCRMRGPAEETDLDIQKNMVTSQSERRFGKLSMSRKNCMRAESGTCNVCSAPCSSCMHLNLALMGSKTEEFSDETCLETTGSEYSINKCDALHSFKGRHCDSLQHAASEASKLPSVNLSHDSFSVNSESKATLRSSDISDASEDFEMHPKFSSSGAGAEDQISPKPEIGLDHRISSNKYSDPKSAEGHDDNILCGSGANDGNAAVSDHDRSVDVKNLSHSSASVGSLGPEGLGKAPSSQKLELSRFPSLEKIGASCGSPNVPSPVSHSQSDKCLVEGSSGALTKVYPKSEADTDKDSGDPHGEALTCSVEDKQELKSTQLAELPDVQPLRAASGDETDESDIVEHDVKVCDICGDAGREDLLAICSRCIDGAEHTYCMKEMLQKVPEGDWLCEECKFAEETKKQKQGVDLEGKRTNKPSTSTQSSVKRHAENLDAAPAAKRKAIETSIGSPKSLSPSKTAALTRDSSFKNLDKGKVRPASFGNNYTNDVVESARSPSCLLPQTTKGTLSKSSSFSTLNPKAKVKLVDEAVQKLKGTREQASLDIKEGPTRLMTKSMSFKSASSGRSTVDESKFRAVSPRPSQVHDLKGLKHVKELNAFERKGLSRLDRSLTASSIATSVIAPKVDQKLTPRGEAVSLPSASNNRESKVVKSESKGSILTKSNSNLARKHLEVSGTPDGALSTSAMCSSSAEQKPNLVSPKEEPTSSSSWAAMKLSTNVTETVQDGLPRSVESTTQGEKPSSCHTRATLTAGSEGALCQKCKEMGHDVESCPLGSSAGRNSRKDTIKGNKLKAAIEAAMHKLPGTYGRNRVNDKSDGLGIANMDLNCDRSNHDQFSIYNKMKGTHEVPINKQTTVNHLKQFATHPTDVVFPLRVSDSVSIAPSDVKPLMRDWPGHTLADSSALLKISAVPVHEYIWQGGLEVHRGGKLPDFRGGIQAHLSSCASPKVLEMANKLPQTIHLNEVPRVSTWPTMFHESGAKEDNIALYFFAKDYESYERNYKDLVDSLIKSDLALKGNLDGIELLIFPSNQLPENCQRWNMLFFLWGVFRARKVSCSNSSKYSCIAGSNIAPFDRVIATENMSLSQTTCLPKHADKDSAACDTSHNIVPGQYGPDKTCIKMNGNCDSKVSYLQQTTLGSQSNPAQQDGKLDSRFSSKAARIVALLSAEMRRATPLEEYNLSEVGLGTEVEPSLQAIRTIAVSSKGGMTEMNGDASLGEDSSLLKNFSVGNEGVHDEESVHAEKVPEIIKCGRDQINLEEDLNEESIDVENVPDIMKSGREQIILERGLNSGSVGRDQINLERDLNEDSVDSDIIPVIMKSGRDQINLERDLNEGSVDSEKTLVIKKSGRDQISLERDLSKSSVDGTKVPVITKSGRDQINLERDLNEVSVDARKVPNIKKSGRDQFNLERGSNKGSIATVKVLDIMKNDRDQIDLQRYMKDDNAETSLDRDLNFKGVNHRQSNHQNSRHLDLIETAAASSCGISRKMPWNEAFVDGESIGKKLKAGFAGAHECNNNSRDGDSCTGGFSLRRDEPCSSSSNHGRSEEFSDKNVILKDVGSSERYFFPVGSHRANDFRFGANSVPWKELSSEDEDRFLERVPNLELALGADTKQQNKGMLPFFVGPVDKKNNQDKPPDKETDKGAAEDVSASLSLSLSFPIPDKEKTNVKPASKTEQLLPERRHVNTSLLLFGGFLDK